jgi:lipopolysaccharide export system ATP-binding protein
MSGEERDAASGRISMDVLDATADRVPSVVGAVLRAESLIKCYGRWRAVDRVSLEVHPGEVVGLLGPNGAGKTTTFHMIVGFIRADGGEIFLGGRRVTGLPMHRRARLGIGYLSQEPSIFRKLTVRENLLAILETLHLGRAERRARCDALMEEFDLVSLAHRRSYTLSGGERRRVEIARALATRPAFLLLDEPFVGIDPIAVGELQDIVARLKERGIGILMTDHNVRETLTTTDRAYIMFRGHIVVSGSAETLANDPQARKVYLGERFRL